MHSAGQRKGKTYLGYDAAVLRNRCHVRDVPAQVLDQVCVGVVGDNDFGGAADGAHQAGQARARAQLQHRLAAH